MTPPDPTRRIIAAQQRDLDRAARPARSPREPTGMERRRCTARAG
jgi:hypothetical protein